ncbi:MAG: chitobiase/beta-hexosaminidase C-terminal domain-containing protein, partial [Spirochaetota bacterium]
MTPTTAGSGSVDLAVSWDPPSLIDAVESATLTPDGGAAIDIADDLDIESLASGTIAYRASLDSGVYRLEIRLAREGSFVAIVMEAVHVYDNVETSGTIALTGDQVGQPPAEPADLAATAAGGAVELSWTDVSPVNDHYEIQWRLQGEETWQSLDTIDGATDGYIHDISAVGVGNFEHRIRGTNAFGPAVAEEGWVEFPIVSTGDFPPAPAPTIVAPSTPYVNGTRWRISSTAPDATIYYTTNGEDPTTSSGVYDSSDPIVLTTGDSGPTEYTIKALAVAPGFNPGTIAGETVTIIPGRVVTQFNTAVGIPASNTPNSLRAMISDAYDADVDGLTFTWHEDLTDADIINDLGNPGSFEISMPIGSTVTVDGGDLDIWNFGFEGHRHFFIDDGGHLILRNITLSGQEISVLDTSGGNGLGGIIYVADGGTLELENVTFRRPRNGSATGGGTDQIRASGAAIGNDGGTVIVRNSVFYGGVATLGGGAIANVSGTTTIEESWFVGNRLVNALPTSENSLQTGGAAIAVYGGTVTVSDSVFYGNTTEETPGDPLGERWDYTHGGAIAVFNDGSLNVQSSYFLENTGLHASAIHIGTGEQALTATEPAATGKVRIGSSVFYRNEAVSEWGGAIHVHWGMGPPFYDIEVHTSTFVENSFGCDYCSEPYAAIVHPRDEDGGAAYWFNSLFVNDGIGVNILGGPTLDASENDSSGTLTVDNLATVFASPPQLPPLASLGFDELPMYGGSNDFSVLEGLEGNFTIISGSSVESAAVDQGNDAHVMQDYADLDGDGNTTERESLDLNGGARRQGTSIDRGAVESSGGFVPSPSFDPPAGRYDSGFDLEIAAPGASAIYYTTDGSDPDPDDPDGATEEYFGPIPYAEAPDITVRAIAVGAGGVRSEVSEAVYTSPGTIAVTTAAATGTGSLGEAVAAALEGDTILFDADYTITAPDPLSAAPNWFVVSESITIDVGENDIVLDANELGRHFLVDGSATLTLRSDAGGSLTLQNGRGIDNGVAGQGGA